MHQNDIIFGGIVHGSDYIELLMRLALRIKWSNNNISQPNAAYKLHNGMEKNLYHSDSKLWFIKKTTWWRHQMGTFPRNWPFVRGIHRSPVNSPHKGQWHGALMFFICVWTNGSINTRDGGDLRRHHAHYGVIAMNIAAAIQLSLITLRYSSTN